MAPTPKPPGTQRRRMQAPTTRTLLAEGRQGKAPALPRRSPAWSAETKAWWARIWSSPSATQWAEADYDVAVRLARIMEAILERPDVAALHAAASGLEDRLGLSPRARRILGWETARQDDAPAGTSPASAATLQRRADTLRGRLHVV